MLEIELKQLFNSEIKKYRKGYLSAIYTFKIKNSEIYSSYVCNMKKSISQEID